VALFFFKSYRFAALESKTMGKTKNRDNDRLLPLLKKVLNEPVLSCQALFFKPEVF